MKRITAVLLLALGLFASAAFGQTATVNSLSNITNKGATYYASTTYTLVGAPTDTFVIGGSATKTVYVKDITANCTLTTAAQAPIYLIKRSTATTVVSATAVSAVPADSSDSAATATVNSYVSGTAANPTVGTNAGTIATESISMLAPGTAAAGRVSFFREFGTGMDRYITLRGTAQNLAINFAGATLTGAICYITTSWIER